MSSLYLYGASVQGIQGFIFETSKLQEIAGASELVEQICTQAFYALAGISDPDRDPHLHLAAAGNIKYLFHDRAACARVVRAFPRKVMQMAPGITVSQAVVAIEGDFANHASNAINVLEQRLRAQRNRPPVQHQLGWMVSERARRTGKPGVDTERDRKTALDAGQLAKRQAVRSAKRGLLAKLMPETDGRGYHQLFASEMEDIAGDQEKGWIAIIHADGNDLGKKIMRMAKDQAPSETFRDMSRKLGRATEQAAQLAFDMVVRRAAKGGRYPIRPVLLGGDDLTAIVRGDLALDFTETFLAEFERETQQAFAGFGYGFDGGLTACAGIAYIKVNYPFHYGADLAETLCAQAKKVAKAFEQPRTPACLLFHKVHASFVEDYGSIIDKELTAGGIRLDYGPYFLNRQTDYATISDLQQWMTTLNQPDSPRSRLRNWLTDLQVNPAAAQQQLDRIRQITDRRYAHDLKLATPFTQRADHAHTHLFDAMALTAIQSPSS